jgi:CheY-like chemotaxis protein
MLLDTFQFLQKLLLPLLLGALVVGGLAVYLVGRKPRSPRRPAAQPRADAAPPAAAAARRQPPSPSRPASAADVQAADSATTAEPAPAAQAAAATPRRSQAADQGLPLVADLLLVDDSAVVRAKLRRLFEPAGFRIALARDGAEALALLGAGRYALMLTDLEMPKLDGVGLIRATLALPACASMPILAITGHDDLQSQLNQLNAVAGIYRKPWVDDDLLGHVQALVQPAALRELATAEA